LGRNLHGLLQQVHLRWWARGPSYIRLSYCASADKETTLLSIQLHSEITTQRTTVASNQAVIVYENNVVLPYIIGSGT